jgi:hypothetical protein
LKPVAYPGLASTWARPAKDNQNTSCSTVKSNLNGKTNWVYQIGGGGVSVNLQGPVITLRGNVIIASNTDDAETHTTRSIRISNGILEWTGEANYNGNSAVMDNSLSDEIILAPNNVSRISIMTDGTPVDKDTSPYTPSGAPLDINGTIIYAKTTWGV